MGKEHDKHPSSFMLEDVVAIAKSIILEHGWHAPTLIIEGNRKSVIMQLVNIESTHEGRVQQMYMAGRVVGETGQLGTLKQVFFVSEGWMSLGDGDNAPEMPPSQDPQRKEVLFVSSLQAQTQKGQLALFEMIRDDQAKLVELSPIQQGDEVQLRVSSPLLTAFVQGFRLGRVWNIN
ncbi:MAG: hypothetical protein K8L97_31185 [Anaerolineae bacterium]|nr:hypothetical protein [Anaerolineae bacterium]